MVGISTNRETGLQTAVLWSASKAGGDYTSSPLPTLDSNYSHSAAINSWGDIAGISETYGVEQGVVWQRSGSGGDLTLIELGVPGGDDLPGTPRWSRAKGINDSGVVVGDGYDGVTDVALVWLPTHSLGSAQIYCNVDSNPPGTAEAFRYVAIRSGVTSRLSVYLDTGSTATKVMVGVYAGSLNGNPGALLTSGVISFPTAGSWNTVNVPPTTLRAGDYYWLAIAAPLKSGTIKFRDMPSGKGGATQTSAQRSLTLMGGLPKKWSPGARYNNSPASLYAAPGS